MYHNLKSTLGCNFHWCQESSRAAKRASALHCCFMLPPSHLAQAFVFKQSYRADSDESISFHLPTNTHKHQLQSDSIPHWISHTCLHQHKERGQDRQLESEIEYRYIHCFLRSWIKAFSSAQLQLHSAGKVGGCMLPALLPATSLTWNLIPSLPFSCRICFILGSSICLLDLVFPTLCITPPRTTLLVSREN